MKRRVDWLFRHSTSGAARKALLRVYDALAQEPR